MSQAWSDFHRRFPLLGSPLIVTPEIVANLAAAIEGHEHNVLLLGVTPPLSALGDRLVAVDRSPGMIQQVWPGDDGRRRVVEADWRKMAPEAAPFSAAIGDGSFNCLAWPEDYATVFARLAALLSPGARLAIRFYVRPDDCESLDTLAAATMAGRVESVHALKWRVAMAACAERGIVNIPAIDILAAFDQLFPDRDALARATGWTAEAIGTLDFYRGSADIISFPTAAQIFETLPPGFGKPRLLGSGSYALAERCPLLVANRTE